MWEPLHRSTTVVDVTHQCNAKCKYCQWGTCINPFRKHLPLEEILLSAETVKALGTERIVISGGEPRLHPKLPQILSHYRRIVDSVIVISNGYGLDRPEIRRLVELGATGITFSLDSALPDESMLTRGTTAVIHRKIISSLLDICKHQRDFELGINSVVSHVTANWKTVSKMLEFGYMLGVDFVKFQPIFDDGYVRLNAPGLMLTPSDSPKLSKISILLETIKHPSTNPPGFWKNIAALVIGKQLSSACCGLGHRQSLVIENNINICYWLRNISFGNVGLSLEPKNVRKVKRSFESAKLRCKVDFQCFCTQSLSHVWKNRQGEAETVG